MRGNFFEILEFFFNYRMTIFLSNRSTAELCLRNFVSLKSKKGRNDDQGLNLKRFGNSEILVSYQWVVFIKHSLLVPKIDRLSIYLITR